MTTRIAVVGSTGRLGSLVTRIVRDDPAFELGAELHSGSDFAALADCDLVVDVTLPHISPGVVRAGVRAGRPVLVGTSGWSADRVASLRADLPKSAQVLIVPNFSIGSVLATRFAEQAASWFDSAEIIEAHHAGKSDSPSGTAVRTAERMAAARGELGPVSAPHVDQRARGQQVAAIPVHSLRLDGVVARQDVLFGGPGEVLTIRHDTTSPIAYTAGITLALRELPNVHGVQVGLEALLFGVQDAPATPAVREDAPSGQSARLGG